MGSKKCAPLEVELIFSGAVITSITVLSTGKFQNLLGTLRIHPENMVEKHTGNIGKIMKNTILIGTKSTAIECEKSGETMSEMNQEEKERDTMG